MNKVSEFVLRGFFKIVKKVPFTNNLDVSVLSGPLKGYKINIQSLNSYILGLFENDAVDYLPDNNTDGKAIYDIGAHIGYFSMIFAQRSSKVYAFEPMPQNQNTIKKHLALNKVDNVELQKVALSDKVGTVQFTVNAGDNSNTYKSESPFLNKKEIRLSTVEVKTDTVDNLIFGEKKLLPPALLKIDVEGAEYDVLLGSKKTIDLYKPIILLSTHDVHVVGVSKQCLLFLENSGYSSELLVEHMKGMQDFYCKPIA